MGFNFIYSLAKRYYHLWYYNANVWQQTTWMGVQTYKSPMDMWNYQEILVSLQPAVVIEFGTWHGLGPVLFVGNAADRPAIRSRFRGHNGFTHFRENQIRSKHPLVDHVFWVSRSAGVD